MMTLITAALVAAQPAPATAQHGQMPMDAQKHEAMKEKCCCDDMKKGDADKQAEAQPQDRHGR